MPEPLTPVLLRPTASAYRSHDAYMKVRSELSMSKTYAIADLHCRFDLLEMVLAKIANHAALPATIVTLGDYVDRV
jgi:hypothetical protein